MVNFTITASDLPEDFSGTPQDLFEAILDALTITADSAAYVEGAEAPLTDQGPWFKNGTELYVWTGAAYEPVDTGESVLPQIIAQATEPDSALYQFWLKTNGPVIEGLYYFAGTEAGWVAEAQVIPDGSLYAVKFASGSITTEKISDASIKQGNIAGPIPFSKMGLGTPRQFLRTNDSLEPAWESVVSTNGTGQTITLDTLLSFAHGLGELPHRVRAAIQCVSSDLAWAIGDEVSLGANRARSLVSGIVRAPVIYCTPTSFSIRFDTYLQIHDKNMTGFSSIDPAKWVLKFYVTKH